MNTCASTGDAQMPHTYRCVVSLNSGSRICLQFGHRTVSGVSSLGAAMGYPDFSGCSSVLTLRWQTTSAPAISPVQPQQSSPQSHRGPCDGSHYSCSSPLSEFHTDSMAAVAAFVISVTAFFLAFFTVSCPALPDLLSFTRPVPVFRSVAVTSSVQRQ